MSLARTFTKRMQRSGGSVRRSSSIRNNISSPIALLSTTNMLSYTAPDIASFHRIKTPSSPASTSPSTTSRSSEDDSDATPSASTDASSVENSPIGEHSPHSGYFQPGAASSHIRKATEVIEIPAIPERAPSHSKLEHERLSRKRSLQTVRPPSSIQESALSRHSAEIISSSAPNSATTKNSENPFSQELAQLNEMAEEFGGVTQHDTAEDDWAIMQLRGLSRFHVNDYLQEIQPLWAAVYDDPGAWP